MIYVTERENSAAYFRRKRFMWLILPGHSQLLKKMGTETEAGSG